LTLFWEKGYAHEIVSKTVDYAKNNLNISIIVAITTANNDISIRLLEKIGFRFIKPIIEHDSNEELLLYRN